MHQAHSKKNVQNRLEFVPCPGLGCCILPIPGIEPMTSPLQMHCLTIRVLAISYEYLLGNGIHILGQYLPPKIPTKFSVCCGMLQNPHQ